MRSTSSCAVWEVFRVLTLVCRSLMRVWDELGVGRGDPEGVRLGPGDQVESCDCVWEAAIGGKEGENMDGGRWSPFVCGGRVWWFLYHLGPTGLCIGCRALNWMRERVANSSSWVCQDAPSGETSGTIEGAESSAGPRLTRDWLFSGVGNAS